MNNNKSTIIKNTRTRYIETIYTSGVKWVGDNELD
jgi:hypothetical protein